jgi:3-oxoacyl-[acyl-carrier protein] reductase
VVGAVARFSTRRGERIGEQVSADSQDARWHRPERLGRRRVVASVTAVLSPCRRNVAAGSPSNGAGAAGGKNVGMSGEGSVILITGAGRGIGREIAVRLGAAGHRLGLTSRTDAELAETADLVTAAGGAAVVATGDVTRPADVDRVCRTVEDRFGPIEALVNNAGFLGDLGPFLSADLETWWRVLEINLRGPALFSRRVLPSMVERGNGRVININSKAAFMTDPRAAGSAYGVSKTALLRLSDVLTTELAGTGVIMIDLSPGMVRTAMTARRPDADRLPPESWAPAAAAAGHVEALLSGRYDALNGHFVHILDDLDDLLTRVTANPQVRTLQVIPTRPADPVMT